MEFSEYLQLDRMAGGPVFLRHPVYEMCFTDNKKRDLVSSYFDVIHYVPRSTWSHTSVCKIFTLSELHLQPL